MSKPHRVWTAIAADLENLQYIADSRKIDILEKTADKLITELSSYTSILGLSIFLKLLKPDLLNKLSNKGLEKKKKDRTHINKATLVKRIQDAMEEEGTLNYFDNSPSSLLSDILKYLDLDIPESKKEKISAIINSADEMGLENIFSSFAQSKLKELIKNCGLKVDSDSMETLLRCLVDQESIKAPFASEIPPSAQKPDINYFISIVDLHHHYFKEDLAEWCKSMRLNNTGSKKVLVERIRRYWDNMLIESDRKINRRYFKGYMDPPEYHVKRLIESVFL